MNQYSFHRFKVPRKPSEVAKTLDGEEGVLLDINIADDTNNNSITFQEYYQTSIENELDPATAELQQVSSLLKIRKFREISFSRKALKHIFVTLKIRK